MTQKKNKKNASWDGIFRKVRLSKIPFPSKLSQEYYDKIKLYLPHSAKILEAGSGTGEISAYLAKNGHKVYLLDKSVAALNLSRRLFFKYNLKGTFIKGDLFSIPFPDNTFDCVWNSGVLEHFSEKEIVFGLQEMSRVSKDLIITLVPSAQGVIYRLAKHRLEAQDSWSYGSEYPKYTLKPQFSKSNIKIIKEEFIGAYFGIMWLKEIFKVSKEFLAELSIWAESLEEDPLKSAISYLLLTIGTKKSYNKLDYNLNDDLRYKLLDKENQISILHDKVTKLEKKLKILEHSRFWRLYQFLKQLKIR